VTARELVVLGTASQVPTRRRGQNGYFLRWDDLGLLFDPGEGTQRQMLRAGVAASDVTGICITHFHGDHCLGLPGVVQRISLDRVAHPVDVHFPAGGTAYYERLRHASAFRDVADVRARPITGDGPIPGTPLVAYRLWHSVEAYGFRLVEPDGRRMRPDRLAALGIEGPAVGELARAGHLDVAGRRVTLDLTAAQAAKVAAESGVRTLVLTHFSQRYDDPQRFVDEARRHFDGELVVAEDLMRVPVPPRMVT
jgi:ribonuclease Z